MGFSWDSADEAKMQQTFGAGRSLFARFLDLQQVRSLPLATFLPACLPEYFQDAAGTGSRPLCTPYPL